MNIEIPSYTPAGNKIETVGIWLSGGADSSLLCYLLAKKILQESLPLKIQPITVDYKRPFRFIAGDVVAEIKKSLSANTVFKEHLVYNPPADVVWSHAELTDQFHQLNKKHILENKFQVLYSGITTNPPIAVQEKFNWGVLVDVEAKRGNIIPKNKIRHILKQEHDTVYEFYEIKPFFDLTKQDIASIYLSLNIEDTLFPVTRSCEDLASTEGHCGVCWWCEERLWAFGRLK
jgi:7-cyano-7-deazaguanine synthase in queuosine biosynthesis